MLCKNDAGPGKKPLSYSPTSPIGMKQTRTQGRKTVLQVYT